MQATSDVTSELPIFHN